MIKAGAQPPGVNDQVECFDTKRSSATLALHKNTKSKRGQKQNNFLKKAVETLQKLTLKISSCLSKSCKRNSLY